MKIIGPLRSYQDLPDDACRTRGRPADDDVCPQCDGAKVAYVECQRCGGSGEGRADGARCWVCRGTGDVLVKCPSCDGSGYAEDNCEEGNEE